MITTKPKTNANGSEIETSPSPSSRRNYSYTALEDGRHSIFNQPVAQPDSLVLQRVKKEVQTKLAYVLAVQMFVALMVSSSVGTACFPSQASDMGNEAVTGHLLVNAFSGSILFAAMTELEAWYGNRLVQMRMVQDATGDFNELFAERAPDYQFGAYKVAVISLVGGLMFAALGLGTVAAEKLAELVTDKAGSVATKYLSDSTFHALGGAVLPGILAKCGVKDLPNELKIIYAVALASILLGEAIVEFGIGQSVTNPYAVNAIVASVVAIMTAATISALPCLPNLSCQQCISSCQKMVGLSQADPLSVGLTDYHDDSSEFFS